MIAEAICAARVPWPPNSIITATTIFGSLAGAKPTKHAWLSSVPVGVNYPLCAVPVFPASWTPLIADAAAVPFETTPASAPRTWSS